MNKEQATRLWLPGFFAMCGVWVCGAADVVFQDGFESGTLGPAWAIETSNDGRCTVSTNYAPADGNWHLVLDDGVSDAVYSVASAVLRLDLSMRKNVVLSFKAKSLGNEYDYFDLDRLDAVSISGDGGKTWEVVQGLAWVATEWQSFVVHLDGWLNWGTGDFGKDFRIRFSEYDNAPAPIDGIAIDDVLITGEEDQRAVLELPAELWEGTGPYTGYVLLAYPPTNVVTVALSVAPDDQLSLPQIVEVPVGQTYASFEFSVPDDSLANLNREVAVSGIATNIPVRSALVKILDDDAPAAVLHLPAQLVEGGELGQARLVLDRPPTATLTMDFRADPSDEIWMEPWQSIIVPAGSTEAVFFIRALDDNRIDGNVPVTVTLYSSQLSPVTAQTLTIDNEERILSLSLPNSVLEGTTGVGVVRISGTLAYPMEVTLGSQDENACKVPATVIIPAWGTTTEFQIQAPNNSLREGNRHIQISASAAGFPNATASLTIQDNEALTYRFGMPGDIVNIGKPVSISLWAVDAEGNIVSGGAGTVNLYAVWADGHVEGLNPPTVGLSGSGGWSGEVTLPSAGTAPFRLRALDGWGNSGDSDPCDVMRLIELNTADLVWDGLRHRIYATVQASASNPNANQVVAIDPETLQITGRLALSQDPGQMVLTTGGEFLYVALNANGSICRINLDTMTVDSTFAVGTDPLAGTLYAADMCAIQGQPRSLVISREQKAYYPRHKGVAVYDDGVARPIQSQGGTGGSNLIEPSADPSIFFGYDTETSQYGVRKLRVDATGVTEVESNRDLFQGVVGVVSDGNRIFSDNGVQVDGADLKKLGVFQASGLVRPDLAKDRVYFLERDPYYWWDGYRGIGAYDPTSFSRIRVSKLPERQETAGSFIRWGTNGLVFRTPNQVALINGSQLVPTEPTADLKVTLGVAPSPAVVASPLMYTVGISNQGPATAKWVNASVTLSDSQPIQSVDATLGTPAWSNSIVTLPIPELASGALVTLRIMTVPESAGTLACSAIVSSASMDRFADNTAKTLVRVIYPPSVDVVNELRLGADNLAFDPSRGLLWASVPTNSMSPLAGSIISINPADGMISEPIPFDGNPVPGCMAVSGNGRYLYVGLSDAPEMLRVDLAAGANSELRIPLGGQAIDVEPLEGDGTGFLITRSTDNAAVVFDGEAQRGQPASGVSRIERTSTPGRFVGYNNRGSSFELSSLDVTPQGVAVTRSNMNVISGYGVDIVGEGSLVLSSSGLLADSGGLTLKANFDTRGRPCLDAVNRRAYIVYGDRLFGFDTVTFLPAGSLRLPMIPYSDWALICVRWGLDGFAILGTDGTAYIARWPAAIPADIDSNQDGISDAWEATYFGTLNVSLGADADSDGISNAAEYFFGTSPVFAIGNPMQVAAETVGVQPTLKILFPRRAGLQKKACSYELSSNLAEWAVLGNVTETVLSIQTIGGVEVEMVQATVPSPQSERGFVRVKWAP